jgi:hypothetical protein
LFKSQAAEFRERAKQCEDRAQHAVNPFLQSELEAAAKYWLELAYHHEELEREMNSKG